MFVKVVWNKRFYTNMFENFFCLTLTKHYLKRMKIIFKIKRRSKKLFLIIFWQFLIKLVFEKKKFLEKLLHNHLYKNNFMWIWKYCVKPLLGLTAFLIDSNVALKYHQKNVDTIQNPDFLLQIRSLMTDTVCREFVYTKLLDIWKYFSRNLWRWF